MEWNILSTLVKSLKLLENQKSCIYKDVIQEDSQTSERFSQKKFALRSDQNFGSQFLGKAWALGSQFLGKAWALCGEYFIYLFSFETKIFFRAFRLHSKLLYEMEVIVGPRDVTF